MFQKNKINFIYRLLCLLCFALVVLMVDSIKSLIILFIVFSVLALFERSFKNIELIVITLLILGLSYLVGYYVLFRIMLLIDFAFYFLDTEYYDVDDDVEDEEINEKELIRFKKKKKEKGLNNITALYITVHLVVLFIGIWVG